jgi:hypothetical protein
LDDDGEEGGEPNPDR